MNLQKLITDLEKDQKKKKIHQVQKLNNVI